jgi:hypothetical protein
MKSTGAYLAVLGLTGALTAVVVVLLLLSGGSPDARPESSAAASPLDPLVLGDAVSAAHADHSRHAVGRPRGHGGEAGRAAGRGLYGSDDGLVRLGPPGVSERGSARGGATPGGVPGGGIGDPPQVPRLPLGHGIGGSGANVATISAAVEQVTAVTGGAVDGVAPGAGAPVTQVGSGVGNAIGDAGTGVSGPLN